MQVCGTLRGWRDLVAVLALCVTFAAPLLALLHRPSFALVLFVPSKVGKSFAQLAAASAMGFGREKELPTLNATPPGLQAAALAFNDHVILINEVGTAQGMKHEIYEVLLKTTYRVLSEQDTIRHPSWSGGGGGAATYSVIAMFSSEISPDTWAARNGETRDDGEMARLIGVTGAPAYFAQVIFQEVAKGSHFIGGAPLAHDHHLVYGRISAGRPPETRRALIERLVADIAAAGDMPSFSVWVYLLELPASAMAEFGRVLPEPGEEAPWAASLPSDERQRMTSLGRGA